MSARITWQPSADADIASYDLERAASIGGPWTLLQNILHNPLSALNPNWDVVNTVFFYVDALGTETTYYRLTAIDALGQRSPVSSPFRASSAPSGAPGLVNTVSIVVGDVATLLDLGFTTIEVYETEGAANFDKEVTSATAQPATLTSLAIPGSLPVGGATLSFSVNGGTDVAVQFGSIPEYWTAVQIRDVINVAAPGTASVVGTSLVLSSITTGRSSSIQITAGAGLFGFESTRSYGTDSRLLLVDGQTYYQFFDTAGSSLSRYRWRFSNNGENPISKLSAYVSATTAPMSGVPISIGYARFSEVDGRASRVTVLVAAERGEVVNGVAVSGEVRTFTSDENGYLQVPLVQGARIRVAVEGMSLVRTITVPATTSFDLLQAVSDAVDMFTVQVPAPLLTRRAL